MGRKKYLEQNGEIIYPVTLMSAVEDNNGDTLVSKLDSKQDTLISGENIKTLRGQSILGSGNIVIADGSNILYYTGLFYNNGVVVEYNPSANKYWLSANEQYYANIVPRENDIILFFVESILVVTKCNGLDEGYVSVDKIKAIDLKGVPGAIGSAGVTSAYVYIDDTSGTPDAQLSVNNQVLTLVLSGLKGAQGNSGYSGAANELQVVNNLTDGGESAALSAEMGKTLNESIPRLQTITEDAYELLVLNNNVDPDVYYFIYEQ